MARTRRKQSTAKKSSGNRARKINLPFNEPTTENTVKKIRREAQLLLRGESDPALKSANEIVTKLVVKGTDAVAGIDMKALFLLSCVLSVKRFPGYATLDSDHVERIEEFIEDVKHYVEDLSQKRPLNFLMLAAPGAGKSHFIKCIAYRLQPYKVAPITFNMAGLQRHEDLIPPLDAVRNLKVQDHIPLLFLDEFDAVEANTALLLPLLWDGTLTLGQRDLKLGKVIIVLAGSHPNLQTTMNQARSMKLDMPVTDGRNPKWVDLLSRINGGEIEIPSFQDRPYDKVCIAVELLRQRFPKVKQVPLALLRFLARTDFRYGARSIATFINMIPYKKETKKQSKKETAKRTEELRIQDIHVPLDNWNDLKENPLAYHLLHEDQAHGVADTWNDVIKDNSTLPIPYTELFDSLQTEGLPPSFLDFQLGFLVEELDKLSSASQRSHR